MDVHFDARELETLARAINRLPGEIKAKAMGRAMRRMRDMMRTRVVRLGAERVKIPASRIRQLTTAHFNAGGNSIDVVEKSGWIPLYKLGATETKRGVRVRGRGSYQRAFLAQMKSGHRGVFRRVKGAGRYPIRELFGPNPAHDITNNPDEYLELLAELIETHLAGRVLHEIDRLLPR